MSYLFAVLAAIANATASVLQRKANRQESQDENLSWRLIWNLLHRPVWLAGVASIIAAFLLQVAALSTGQLAVVEPILAFELPLTLLFATRLFGADLARREWGAAAAMTAGLAGLLYFMAPAAGHAQEVRWYVWVIGVGANAGLVAALVLWSRNGLIGRSQGQAGGARRAAILGVAAGSMFGLTAALMKAMTNDLARGFSALFTGWPLYAMIIAGASAMFLLQSAMNAGRLLAAQPGLTLSDPVVSIAWGVAVFGEKVRGGLFLMAAALCGVLIAGSVIVLARSPLLSGASAQHEESDRSTTETERSTAGG